MPESKAKSIIKTGLILFAITAVSALLLAVVNGVTAPIIESNSIEKTNASMRSVFKDAKDFVKVERDADTDKTVTEIYLAKDESSATIGACICVSPNGYGGAIDMVVGVGADTRVTGVDIISQSETAGLGAKAVEEEFRNQFIGKGIVNKVVKSNAEAKDDEINAITSATITSKAVTDGVNTAISETERVLAKEGK